MIREKGTGYFMKLPKNLGWKIYFVFFFFWASSYTFELLWPHTAIHLFYRILMAFHGTLKIFFIFNVVYAFFELLAAIGIYLYIYEISFLDRRIWRHIFWIRIILSLFGRLYETIFVKSLIVNAPSVGWAFLISAASLLIPSYLILYKYAFRKEQEFIIKT